MTEKQLGQIRHGISAIGAALIAAGAMTPAESAGIVEAAMGAVGALSVVWALVWSWRSKP